MLVTASFLFITLIGFAAVAVDVGHIFIARNELQNAADAAALAGANCLTRTTAGSGTDCTAVPGTTLNWTIANTKATNSIPMNKADGTFLVNGTVTTGYKNLAGSPSGLQPTTLSPVTANDKPAVMVTLTKAPGQNGGAIPLLISSMFGAAAVPVTATAVAVVSSPGNVLPGTVIPQVINKCLYDLYWDTATNAPKIYTGDPVDPFGLSTVGQPWQLRIGSNYHYPNCSSGIWTSFAQNVNSQSAVKDLIDNGNPDSLAIGDPIWVQAGTKAASYKDLDERYPTPPGADVVVLMVDLNPLPTSGGGVAVPIKAFAGFRIDAVEGGSGKYIEGHFTKGFSAAGTSGIGSFYGTYTPPRLAQ